MRTSTTFLAVIAGALAITAMLALILRREIVVTPWGYWEIDRWAGTSTACELRFHPSEYNRRVFELMFPPLSTAKTTGQLDNEWAELLKGKGSPPPQPPAMPLSAAIEKAGSYIECAVAR